MKERKRGKWRGGIWGGEGMREEGEGKGSRTAAERKDPEGLSRQL